MNDPRPKLRGCLRLPEMPGGDSGSRAAFVAARHGTPRTPVRGRLADPDPKEECVT
jgi:hypothetical protein